MTTRCCATMVATMLVPLYAAGCTEARGDRAVVERTDSAGVEIVTSTGAVALPWTFDRELTLGGEDDGPASFYQLWDGGLAADGAGNIHILDRGNHRVVVFTSEGEHVRTLGRQGGGPGEFTFPVSLTVTRAGVISVHDLRSRGLIRWSADGALLESRPLDAVAGVAGVAAVGDGLLISERRLDQDRQLDIARLVFHSATDTVVVAQLERTMGPPVQYPDCPVRISSSLPIFAPALVWSAHESVTAAVTGPAYEIRVFDGARHVRTIRRAVTPVAATPELAAATVPNGEMRIRFGDGECRIPAAAVVEVQGHAAVVPAIAKVRLAPDGMLWVERRSPVAGEPGVIDVFDGSGEYLGQLPQGSPFPSAFLPDGRLLVIEKDDLDVERIVVHRVNHRAVRAAD